MKPKQLIRDIFVNSSLSLLFLYAILLAGCKKDDVETPSNDQKQYNSLMGFYEEEGAKSQSFLIDPAVYNELKGAENGIIRIYPNTFIRKVDGMRPSGMVNVELKEIYSKSAMVLSRMPTMSNGSILESGGEVYIGAKDATGVELKIAPAQAIRIVLPTNNPLPGMLTFWGSADSSSVPVNWVTNNDSIQIIKDTLTGAPKYFLNVDSLGWGWINCDRFYNDPSPKGDVTFIPKFPADASGKVEIDFYIVFKSINSVFKARYNVSKQNYSAEGIPVGMQVGVIGIGTGSDKKLYVSYRDLTVAAGQSIEMNFAPSTAGDIREKLKKL